jgi:hypothetical protein
MVFKLKKKYNIWYQLTLYKDNTLDHKAKTKYRKIYPYTMLSIHHIVQHMNTVNIH